MGNVIVQNDAPPSTKQVLWLQSLTIVWMLIECCVSLSSALRSKSVALLAFGSDSSVELLSAALVLAQFVPGFHLDARRAARFSAILLIVLAALVAITSLWAIWIGFQASVSVPGMFVTAGALLFMPVLAVLKRRKARELNNPALAADAVQSATCAYLAAITLVSLVLNFAMNVKWIDSAGAMLALPILIVEARRTWRGEGCGCCR